MSGKKKQSGIWVGLAAVALVGAAVTYFYLPHDAAVTTSAPAQAQKAKSDNAAPAAAPATADAAPHSDLSVAELLKRAGTALGDRRLVEPAGNNAVEYYLLVLAKDPSNLAAQDGLREMFPLATGAVEQQINAGQIDDSVRMIGLLSKADPANYTLTILRSKLDLKKKQIDHDQDKRDQDKLLALNAARNPPATEPPGATTPPPLAAPATTAATSVPTTLPTPPASSTAAPAPAVASAAAPAAAPTTIAAAAAGGEESRAAALVQKVNPSYPADAARKHVEGWVEVGFTVGADGHVKDAVVVSANPARVFNDAALHAVENWTFQPRMESGKAVEQHIKSRIEFKL